MIYAKSSDNKAKTEKKNTNPQYKTMEVILKILFFKKMNFIFYEDIPQAVGNIDKDSVDS